MKLKGFSIHQNVIIIDGIHYFFQVLAIAEEASNKDFVNHILPTLKPVMKITDPIQVNTKKKNYRICSRKMHLVDLFL